MSNFEDKIAELFRNSDEKLVEQPSERARAKFESRLEQRFENRSNRREEVGKLFSRQLSLAAAVVGIIALGGLMTVLYFENRIDGIKNDGIAEYSPMKENPIILPDSQIQANAEDAVSSQVEAEASGTISVEKPTITPKPTEKKSTTTTIGADLADKISSKGSTETTSAATADYTDNTATGFKPTKVPEISKAESVIQSNGEPNEKTNYDGLAGKNVEIENIATTKPSTVIKPAAPPAAPPAPKIAMADTKKDYTPGNQTNASPVYPRKELEEDYNIVMEEQKTGRSAVKESKKQSANKTKNKREPEKKAPIDIINGLNWMVGSWRNDDSKDNFEEWKQIDAYTLRGTGYFIQKNGKTVYLDKIEIRQESGLLFLYLPIDSSGKLKEYPLKKQTDDIYVFENEAISFPQRIRIQRNGIDKFSFEMSNFNGFQLQTKQGDYWRSRNSVLSDKVSREMIRVKK